MPIVQIEMFEGKTIEEKRRLVEKVTEAIVESIGTNKESVSIIIRDMSKADFAKGGQLLIDKQ